MPLLKFLGSKAGRVARVAAGLALIGAGLGLVRGTTGRAMAGVGLLPLAAGTFDVCVLGPVVGLPFRGPRFRRAVDQR